MRAAPVRTVERWARLEEPWRAAVEEAWQAYRAGTIPVGAAVLASV